MFKINIISHVKWFVDEDAPFVRGLDQHEIIGSSFLIISGILFLVALKYYVEPISIWQKITNTLKPAHKYVPDIVRISTGILLITNFFLDFIYAPNIENSWSNSHTLLSTGFALIGALLLAGLYTHICGVLLIGAYVASMFIVSPWTEVLDHAEYIGIGLYLLFAPGGEIRLIGLQGIRDFSAKYRNLAPRLLVAFTGIDLAILAFSEKLANMTDATNFLTKYDWNLLSSLGVSDRNFIIIAGVIELIIGLSFLLNLGTHVTSLGLLGTMILTALMLGPEEIYGHLFAIGVVAAIWLVPQKPTLKDSLKKAGRDKIG